MPVTKLAAQDGARQHLTPEQIGRQLRAAFDPVPTGRDEFADLLRQLDAVEQATARTPVPAE